MRISELISELADHLAKYGDLIVTQYKDEFLDELVGAAVVSTHEDEKYLVVNPYELNIKLKERDEANKPRLRIVSSPYEDDEEELQEN